MATKSVMKSIHINDRRTAIAFVNALEIAKMKPSQVITFQRAPSDASRKEIKAMFRAKDNVT